MAISGTWTLLTGTPALVAGLLVGLLGSYVDDLGAGSVVQVLLWVVSAVLLVGAVVGLLSGAAASATPDGPTSRHPAH